MKKGWVSVVSVFFNRADHVVSSLASLVDQTYEHMVIYAVDDCSDDDTFDRMKAAFGDDRRVVLIRNEKNLGFTRTLIKVIDDLDTEYIAIHGAGDISSPERIQLQVTAMAEHADVGVVTAMPGVGVLRRRFFGTRDLMKKNRVIHGSALFRISAYRQAGGYREFFKSRQDKDLWLRMSLQWRICAIGGSTYQQVPLKSSVSQSDPGQAIPMLLSDFSVHLIRQRILTGTDDLDRHGCLSALTYSPISARKAFLRNIYVRMRAGHFHAAFKYALTLSQFESGVYKLPYYLFLLPILRIGTLTSRVLKDDVSNCAEDRCS